MPSRTFEPDPRQLAKIAGVAYLIIFALGVFANFFVLEGIIEHDDAAATAANVLDSEGLFRAGLVGLLVTLLLDVVVAWALYLYFKRVSASLSLLAAWFRFAYAVVFGAALIGLFMVLVLAGDAEWVAGVDVAQRQTDTMLFLDLFDYGWLIGLACFGAHLLLLGYLALKSGVVPRILAIGLIAAGAAYLLDTFANAVLPSYDDYKTMFTVIVAVPALISEFAFPLWLLRRG